MNCQNGGPYCAYFRPSELSSVVLVHVSVALDGTHHGLRGGIICVLGYGG
jgi:hypothetical protein